VRTGQPLSIATVLTKLSNPDALQKIVTALSIKVAPRDLKSKETRNLLTLIMQQWLPLSTATFQAVIDVIPSPTDAQALRLPYMLHPAAAAASSTPLTPSDDLEKVLFACDQSSGSQVTAYISKMFAVARGDLPENQRKALTAEEMRRRGKEERERRAAQQASQAEAVSAAKPIQTEDLSTSLQLLSLDAESINGNSHDATAAEPNRPAESSDILLGFSRIFSGILRRDTTLLATLPKFDPELGPTHPRNSKYVSLVHVRDLYMMMGRELVAVDEVPAGHVCAIGGLEGKVFRNATLWAPDAGGVKGEVPERLINLAGVSMQVSEICPKNQKGCAGADLCLGCTHRQGRPRARESQ
jgi:ribosome assembly protein 1